MDRNWWACRLCRRGDARTPGASDVQRSVGVTLDPRHLAACVLRYHSEDGPPSSERADKRRALKDGDEVSFMWSEERPDVNVTFHADGTYTVHGADPAPDANNFRQWGDPENGGDSLKFMAELVLDGSMFGMPLEEELAIGCNVWSQPETWRLAATATDYRFERVVTPIAGADKPAIDQGELRL